VQTDFRAAADALEVATATAEVFHGGFVGRKWDKVAAYS